MTRLFVLLTEMTRLFVWLTEMTRLFVWLTEMTGLFVLLTVMTGLSVWWTEMTRLFVWLTEMTRLLLWLTEMTRLLLWWTEMTRLLMFRNMVRPVTFWYTKELSCFENNEDLDATKIDVTRSAFTDYLKIVNFSERTEDVNKITILVTAANKGERMYNTQAENFFQQQKISVMLKTCTIQL